MKITGQTPYGEWLAAWVSVYKEPKLKPHSTLTIRNCIRLHIPEEIKDSLLSELDPFELQRALNAVRTSRLRLYVFDIYRESLRRAAQLHYIPFSPAESLERPLHVKENGKPLTKEELSVFLADIQNDRLKNLYLFYLYTGCRRSEALTVTWDDIDFERNTIYIRETKNTGARRVVPLFKELRSVLSRLPHSPDGLLFHCSPEYATKSFKELCPAHHLHDLRHTFATRCLECGIAIKVVQKWLGHTQLNTTASIYVHCMEDYLAAEANKFRLIA